MLEQEHVIKEDMIKSARTRRQAFIILVRVGMKIDVYRCIDGTHAKTRATSNSMEIFRVLPR